MVSYIAPVQAAGTVNDWIITDYQTSSSTNGIIHFVVFMNISGFSNAPTVYERSEAEAINGVGWTSTTAVSGSWVRDGRAFNYAAIFDLGSSSPGHGKHGLVHVHIYDGRSIVKAIDTSLEVQHFYRGNGGTPDSTEVDYWPNGNQIAPTVTRTGYTFAGWTLTSTTAATVMNALQYTYTAQWTPNYYYLDLNGVLNNSVSGAIAGYGTADVYINGSQVANDVSDYYVQWPYGTTYEIKDIKATTGHTYDGVYSGSLSGTIGAGNVSVSLQFHSNTYTVTYNANGGSGAPATQSFVYGGGYYLSSATPVRTGYTFVNWKDSVGNTFSPGQSIPSNWESFTLYAQWSANSYTVVFNANGGSGSMSNETMTYDTSKALTTNTITRQGYSFVGWNTKPDGSGISYSDGQKVTNIASTNGATVTLYAQWGHWVFDSWNTSADGRGTTYKIGSALPDSNLDLYAQWRYEHVTS